MEKQNRMLKSARMQRAWTPEFVSGLVGVSRSTYIRWESGAQKPRHASLDALCKVFAMSPAELGFMAHRIRQAHTLDKPTSPSSTLSADGIEEINEDDAAEISEEDLPASLETWSAGLASCWERYMGGGQRELERLLPTYLTRLLKPTLTPGPAQKKAANLTAQAYQLIALLDLQRGDFASAEANGTQSLVYSQLARDWNLYVAAQIRLATIFSARKRVGSALNAYNNALHRINTNNDSISPMLHSWIFAGLAEIQATMGRETEALQFLKLALAVFPEKPEEDACAAYARCDRSMLYLYQGLVFLRLGQPKVAWEAFSLVDELKPVPCERMRAEFLKYRAYTSLVLGNMIQSCIYLEAAARAARAINSELVFGEIYALYQHMLAIWGQESRVKALAVLFQS
ncbi:helix-turn-helix domain-containing protein [Dictyobacter halimunensis]